MNLHNTALDVPSPAQLIDRAARTAEAIDSVTQILGSLLDGQVASIEMKVDYRDGEVRQEQHTC